MFNFDKTVKIKRIGNKDKKSIPIICPWCNKIYNIAEWEVEDDEKIRPSHGMCQECLDIHKKELKKNKS